MKIVMDSDCLVKFAKSGVKETIASAMEVFIPVLVKRETVDEAKKHGYQDAFIIEENINKESVHVAAPNPRKPSSLPGTKGEAEVLSLFLSGNYDAIASDDQRFLSRLEAARIPYLTPTACLIYLFKGERVGKQAAKEMLESLRPFVSREEYAVAKLVLEGDP